VGLETLFNVTDRYSKVFSFSLSLSLNCLNEVLPFNNNHYTEFSSRWVFQVGNPTRGERETHLHSIILQGLRKTSTWNQLQGFGNSFHNLSTIFSAVNEILCFLFHRKFPNLKTLPFLHFYLEHKIYECTFAIINKLLKSKYQDIIMIYSKKFIVPLCYNIFTLLYCQNKIFCKCSKFIIFSFISI